MPAWLAPALVAGGSALLGGLSDGQKQKTSSKQSGSTIGKLPEALPFQQTGENYLAQLLAGYGTGGYNPYTSQAGLAGTTSDWMQQLLKNPYQVDPRQAALLEGQTNEYMTGLIDRLNQWQTGAMSQAQDSAIKRGIPLSDIARGQEANVQAQYGRQLGEGYNQAKMQELQSKLQLPYQNLNLAGQLQQQYSSPLMQMLYNVGMSRLHGPRDQYTTGTATGTSGGGWPGVMQGMGQGLGLVNTLFGQGNGKGIFTR